MKLRKMVGILWGCALNVVMAVVSTLSFAASADTIAWWHFDECDPGTTAPANTVGEFDAVRVSKGVLDPSQFMQRAKEGLMIFVR